MKPAQPTKTPALKVSVFGLLTAAGAAGTFATVAAWLDSVFWVFSRVSPFRVQLFIGMALLAIAVIFGKRFRAAATFAGAAVLNLVLIVPSFLPPAASPEVDSAPMRAMLINVNTERGDPARVARAILTTAPDLLILLEVSDTWLTSLRAVLTNFPYRIESPRDDNFGIGVFSKLTVSEEEIREFGGSEVPSITATVRTTDGDFKLIATHPLPPGSRENTMLRNEHLKHVQQEASSSNLPVIIIGDLNATPWCAPFRKLLKHANLQDSSAGRGLFATWPTHLPILLVPLDHFLHSSEIQITKKEVANNVGSDHYPIIVDFVLVPRSAGQVSPAAISQTNQTALPHHPSPAIPPDTRSSAPAKPPSSP